MKKEQGKTDETEAIQDLSVLITACSNKQQTTHYLTPLRRALE